METNPTNLSAAQHTPVRIVRFVHLGLPEARYYLGCKGHMHVLRRVGYRSGAFMEDVFAKATESAA